MSAADILLPEVPDVPSARAYAWRGRSGWLTTPVIIGLIVAGGWIVIGLTIQWWSPYNPIAPSGASLTAPNAAHLLGTDELGRDVLTRTLYGVRDSLPLAFAVVAGGVIVGTVLGGLAGFFGGWLDSKRSQQCGGMRRRVAVLAEDGVKAVVGQVVEDEVDHRPGIEGLSLVRRLGREPARRPESRIGHDKPPRRGGACPADSGLRPLRGRGVSI